MNKKEQLNLKLKIISEMLDGKEEPKEILLKRQKENSIITDDKLKNKKR